MNHKEFLQQYWGAPVDGSAPGLEGGPQWVTADVLLARARQIGIATDEDTIESVIEANGLPSETAEFGVTYNPKGGPKLKAIAKVLLIDPKLLRQQGKVREVIEETAEEARCSTWEAKETEVMKEYADAVENSRATKLVNTISEQLDAANAELEETELYKRVYSLKQALKKAKAVAKHSQEQRLYDSIEEELDPQFREPSDAVWEEVWKKGMGNWLENLGYEPDPEEQGVTLSDEPSEVIESTDEALDDLEEMLKNINAGDFSKIDFDDSEGDEEGDEEEDLE